MYNISSFNYYTLCQVFYFICNCLVKLVLVLDKIGSKLGPITVPYNDSNNISEAQVLLKSYNYSQRNFIIFMYGK